MKTKLLIVAAALFSSTYLLIASCYQAGGGGQVIVSETGCPTIIVQGGLACQVRDCSVRWESTDQACISINPADASGQTACDTSQTAPKTWTRRFGNCADAGGATCYCHPSSGPGSTDSGEVTGQTVKRATLSGSSCGSCPA